MKQERGNPGIFGVMAVALFFAILSAFVLLVGSANAEEKSADADLRQEGEWLALHAVCWDSIRLNGFYNSETFGADEGATECAMRLLREVRNKYPEVADVSVLPMIRTAEITMLIKVKSDEAPVVPAEIQTLMRRLAPDGATLIQFLDDNKAGRTAMIRLYFWKLLHVPSLIAECEKAKEVWDVRDASSPPPPDSDEIFLAYNPAEPMLSRLTVRRLAGKTDAEETWVSYTFGHAPDTAGGFSELQIVGVSREYRKLEKK
jgi:hypothetical protein